MGSKSSYNKNKTTITLDIEIVELEPNTIGIKLTNTGIDLNNDEHYRKTLSVANVVAGILYGVANNIDPDQIKF